MKTVKLLFALLLIMFFAPAAPVRALAEGEDSPAGKYACASARDIYFCESRDLSSAKFVIPFKYCVLVLGEENGWYNVKYADETQYYRPLYGWCLKDDLVLLSAPPEKIFLDMPVTVTIKVDLPSDSLPALSETVTVAYYGEYYAGAVPLSCVMYKNEFYYVPQTFDYPDNEVTLNPPAAEAPKKGGANVKIIAAVALSALAVAALVILYFTGRKTKFRRTEP